MGRSLDHSTIIYESPQAGLGSLSTSTSASVGRTSTSGATNSGTPLLRISPCTKDANLLATFHLDSSTVLILDIRQPGKELYNLVAHNGNINAGENSSTEVYLSQYIGHPRRDMFLLVEGMINKLYYGTYRERVHQDEVILEQFVNQHWVTTQNPKLIICMFPCYAAYTRTRTWGMSASGGIAETVGIVYGKTFQAVSIVL